MKLTTSQIATKLGCSRGAVIRLFKNELLKDYSGKTGRHQYAGDPKEVSEFGKQYKINGKRWVEKSTYKPKITPITESTIPMGPMGPIGMIARLNKLDEVIEGQNTIAGALTEIITRLDYLVKVWS